MRRLLLLLVMLIAWTVPARADDISASARGVVRIVTIAVVGDEVVGFGHGSGFAVAPNRIVTNAHVVELAMRYPDNVVIGVVPSEGERSVEGRLIAVDPDRDLALIEFTGVNLPPLALYNGPVQDGETLIALGYPGNVDLATARSAADYITPQSPVRSQGGFSGRRSLSNVDVLVHTAGIARGNSGGPLLDRCGRVIAVNNANTRTDEGDSSFAFAIAGSELSAFLQAAKQPFTVVGVPCISIEDRLAQDASTEERERAAADARARAAAEMTAEQRQAALNEARANNERTRETYMGIAALLLVLGALGVGGGGLLLSRGRQREAIWVAAGGGVLMLGAVALFLARPGFDENKVEPVPDPTPEVATLPPTAAAGKLQCTLVPERSRVTVTDTPQVALDVGADGCINGRTQYAESGTHWQRILVPEQEATVSVLDYDPATRTYVNTRYLLAADAMKHARELRRGVTLKACSNDQAQRGNLAAQQSAIRAALPRLPNEKLVYRCEPAPSAPAVTK